MRGIFTFLGVATAAFLLWLSTQFDGGTAGYWARLGVVAAAGLALVLAQVFGGWTKWGRPSISGQVIMLGLVPALIVGGWILLAGQPDDNWFQRHVLSWSHDLHLDRVVRHLRERYVGVIAFGLGAVLGFAVDTSGPKRETPPAAEPAAGPEPAVAAMEPEAATVVAAPDGSKTLVVAPPGPAEEETRVVAPAEHEGEWPPEKHDPPARDEEQPQPLR